MKLSIASALLALALPLAAQASTANEIENTFYKAFYLEKGERDFAGAMALYEKFLAAAPEHRLAKVAAQQQFALLQRAGKASASEAFAQKHGALLGGTPVASETGTRPADAGAGAEGDRPGRPGRGEGQGRPGRGEGQAGGFGGRGGDLEARVKELEAALAKAKEEGNEEQIAQLERQLTRIKQMAERGAGAGGQGGQGGGPGGQGGGRMGGRGFGQVKFAEMNEEQLTQFGERLDMMGQMVERMRENGQEERAKAIETGIADVKKALADKKLDDAQKAYDKMMESMRGRGR